MSEFERLFDHSPNPRVREALRAAGELDPPPGAESAVWNALGAKLGPETAGVPNAGVSAPAAAGPSAVSAIALKATLSILAAGAVVAGAYAAFAPDAEPPPAASSVPAVESPRAAADAPEPSASRALPLAPPPNAEQPAGKSSTGATAARRRDAEAARDSALSGSAPTPSNRPAPAQAPSESDLVLAARKALREGRHHEALSVLARADRDFPNGGLAQEREALEIEALSGAGNEERARARARAFLNRYPSSPYKRNVERVLR